MKRNITSLCVSLLVVFAACAPLFGQSPSGTVEGRVFNASTGNALARVRIFLEGTDRETFTDEGGAYRLGGIPAGSEVRIGASYLGFKRAAASAIVPPGGVAQRDFDLSPLTSETEETVRMEAFAVVVDREMSAQALAINEQRYAPNIKNVVAIDEYGDRGDENIGDFMRMLPGVSITDAGLVPNDVSLRGIPSSMSGIQVDGGEVAPSRGTTRTLSLLEVPMGNISRVEVTKVPTPDMPASGLGGTVNLISKSGFESRKPVFNYQAYATFNSLSGLTLDGGPRGPVPALSPDTIQPSFNFSYLRPVSSNLAFSVGGSRSWRQLPPDSTDEVGTWNYTGLFQRQSLWQTLSQIMVTKNGQAGVDWRITPRDTLSANVQYRDASNYTMRNSLTVAYGTNATGGPSFTQGASTGVGTVTLGSAVNQVIASETTHGTLRYRHKGDVWKIEAAGSYSYGEGAFEDIDRGHFYTNPASISSVIVRGEGMGEEGSVIPRRYSAATRTGAAIDLYDGANYSIATATSGQSANETVKSNARLDVTRDFDGAVPLSVKVGAAVDRLDKDVKAFNKTWNFRPGGASDAASRLASRFDVFDDAYNATSPAIFGQRMRWISSAKLYRLFQAEPTWFVLDEAASHQNLVSSSRQIIETVSAVYARADVRLLRNRLWLVGGVRIERTANKGWGSLDDPSNQYQKDAQGNLIRNAAGQPVLITTDAVARAKLRYVERGAYASRDYQDAYPSFNATYNISENLVLRAAYARTIGRPNLNVITPGVSFSEPTATDPYIDVNNPGLKPWVADNFDLSLESYQFKDGFGSIGVFEKNISDFFGTMTIPATPEALALYGLPNDPAYQNYDIRTRTNVGDARVRGLEFAYRQSLTFLPHWARGLQVFANVTKLTLSGSNTADFTGFNPLSWAAGLNFLRPRYYIKITCMHQDQARRDALAVSAANGIPVDTYNYQAATTRWGVSAQYSLFRGLAVYGMVQDIGGFDLVTLRYPPDTPDYATRNRLQKLGSTITIGIKGSF